MVALEHAMGALADRYVGERGICGHLDEEDAEHLADVPFAPLVRLGALALMVRVFVRLDELGDGGII